VVLDADSGGDLVEKAKGVESHERRLVGKYRGC
jgi:hypothetical protein